MSASKLLCSVQLLATVAQKAAMSLLLIRGQFATVFSPET
jgi:hypothetical protein